MTSIAFSPAPTDDERAFAEDDRALCCIETCLDNLITPLCFRARCVAAPASLNLLMHHLEANRDHHAGARDKFAIGVSSGRACAPDMSCFGITSMSSAPMGGTGHWVFSVVLVQRGAHAYTV